MKNDKKFRFMWQLNSVMKKTFKCIIPQNKPIIKKAALRIELTQTMRYHGESSNEKLLLSPFFVAALLFKLRFHYRLQHIAEQFFHAVHNVCCACKLPAVHYCL